jgi:hypothetical protein
MVEFTYVLNLHRRAKNWTEHLGAVSLIQIGVFFSRLPHAPNAERRTVNGERFPSYIAMPPSTVRTWPVMYLASGLAINATAAAISSHSPNLAKGIKERTWVFTASGN